MLATGWANACGHLAWVPCSQACLQMNSSISPDNALQYLDSSQSRGRQSTLSPLPKALEVADLGIWGHRLAALAAKFQNYHLKFKMKICSLFKKHSLSSYCHIAYIILIEDSVETASSLYQVSWILQRYKDRQISLPNSQDAHCFALRYCLVASPENSQCVASRPLVRHSCTSQPVPHLSPWWLLPDAAGLNFLG